MCRAESYQQASNSSNNIIITNNHDKTDDYIIERIGGEHQFDYLILTFAQNIKEDNRLMHNIFQQYDIDELARVQKRLLQTAFLHSKGHLTGDETRNRVVLHNYALFEKGLNETYFDILQNHFVSALHESWIENDAFHLCDASFEALRRIFQESSFGTIRTDF
eukprot:scaffold3033_cov91-Cylindrotheca_fusiformis.AAC.3